MFLKPLETRRLWSLVNHTLGWVSKDKRSKALEFHLCLKLTVMAQDFFATLSRLDICSVIGLGSLLS